MLCSGPDKWNSLWAVWNVRRVIHDLPGQGSQYSIITVKFSTYADSNYYGVQSSVTASKAFSSESLSEQQHFGCSITPFNLPFFQNQRFNVKKVCVCDSCQWMWACGSAASSWSSENLLHQSCMLVHDKVFLSLEIWWQCYLAFMWQGLTPSCAAPNTQMGGGACSLCHRVWVLCPLSATQFYCSGVCIF
jgi:hypothetical protein